MRMRLIVGFLAGFSAFSAQAVELIVNGGFETGSLSGWTTSGLTSPGSCGGSTNAQDWVASNVGTATNCSNPGNPPVGTYAAYNMFDAGKALTYRLRQVVQLPSKIQSANLSWQDSIIDSHSTSSQPRVFSVNVLDGTGSNVLGTLYTYNSLGGSTNTGWVSHTVDATTALSALGGQSVILEFSVAIPQVWTGPAGMGLDAVSLNVVAVPSANGVPSLNEYAIALLSLLVGVFGFFAVKKRGIARS